MRSFYKIPPEAEPPIFVHTIEDFESLTFVLNAPDKKLELGELENMTTAEYHEYLYQNPEKVLQEYHRPPSEPSCS